MLQINKIKNYFTDKIVYDYTIEWNGMTEIKNSTHQI